MEWDTREIARACKECQIHANIPRISSTELTSIVTAVPFARWGIDIVGPFPTASQGRKYLFLAIDYFTKWAEAEPVSSISQECAVKFVFRSIICRFGVPVQIVTDNGTQFAGGGMKKFCKDNEIKLSFTSVYHPQTNGQVEATNKSLIKILKKKVDENPKSWADLIPEVLWAYRTTIKTVNGFTPFTLAFGI